MICAIRSALVPSLIIISLTATRPTPITIIRLRTAMRPTPTIIILLLTATRLIIMRRLSGAPHGIACVGVSGCNACPMPAVFPASSFAAMPIPGGGKPMADMNVAKNRSLVRC